jgi:EAL domain-containing protein (putative c-di-GMP-specific phosphodiesterase class I)/CheY-like chemotaxis protein
MRILVLDDELKIGEFVERVAKKLGIAAALTTSVPDFQAQFAAAVPDAIVLDLQIGENDGIEQLRFLSSERYGNSIILMSGLDDRLLAAAQRVGRGLGLQVTGALQKPMRMAELSEALRQIQAKTWTPSATELNRAIELAELTLDLQPILEAKSRRLLGAEALVRWNHSEHGRIAPDRFIPLAESDVELMDAMTMWVIRKAALLHRELAQVGFSVPIAVNISSKNLRDIRFPDHVRSVLTELGLTSAALSLELTETAAFDDPLRSLDVLSRLRINGFELAIDDFGTGYSSLKLLRQLPFSTIKIDRSFVGDMTSDRDSYSIVKSVIDLAHNMGLGTIAEGVETEEAASALVDLGTDAMQGYLFGRPLPIAQFSDWLKQHAPSVVNQPTISKQDNIIRLGGERENAPAKWTRN